MLSNNESNGERRPDPNGVPYKIWYSKKEAMKWFDVCKTTFYDYIKIHGLKICGVGHKKKLHIDDMNDFYFSHRK